MHFCAVAADPDRGNKQGKRQSVGGLGAKIEAKTGFDRLVTRRSNGLTAFVCNKSLVPPGGGRRNCDFPQPTIEHPAGPAPLWHSTLMKHAAERKNDEIKRD